MGPPSRASGSALTSPTYHLWERDLQLRARRCLDGQQCVTCQKTDVSILGNRVASGRALETEAWVQVPGSGVALGSSFCRAGAVTPQGCAANGGHRRRRPQVRATHSLDLSLP